MNLMKKLLAFTEHQYGVPVEGTSYWMRSNGDRVGNELLVQIRIEISKLHYSFQNLNIMLEFATETRRMPEHRDKSDETTLIQLSDAERLIASFYNSEIMIVFDKAEYHCKQCLMFARLIKGKNRVESEYQALLTIGFLRRQQHRILEAIDYAEQTYILVSEAYGPVHPDVQAAAAALIQRLMTNKDYSRADVHCRMNYENLVDPGNGFLPDSDNVTLAMMQLAEIWLHKAPVDDEKAAFALAEEAEDMMRKACSLVEKRNRSPLDLQLYECMFADVLIKRGKYTDETRKLLERSLAIERSINLDQVDTLQVLGLIAGLDRLVAFHNLVIGTMPLGDARDRELQLRNEYLKEINSLWIRHGTNPLIVQFQDSLSV